uniref:Uncharacterized protein n=1 Tax=Arundo donax TaxID=35708 RepID=A0A0A8YLL9_ARUDO
MRQFTGFTAVSLILNFWRMYS